MLDKLIGHWVLEDWYCTLDGMYHGHPFGTDAQGQLMYAEDGWMYATLMRANRPSFAKPSLVKGTGKEKASAINGYVAYSGLYTMGEHEVYHHVKFSLLPNWIGTDLIREYTFSEDYNELILSTIPEVNSSHVEVINVLEWRKYKV